MMYLCSSIRIKTIDNEIQNQERDQTQATDFWQI